MPKWVERHADEVLNGLSGATSHEAAVESPISAEPNQQTMPSLHKQATAQDSTIAQATEELVDITKPNDTAADAHHVVSEQGKTSTCIRHMHMPHCE